MDAQWFFYITAFAAGTVLGSFLNVVIHRGPTLWKLIDGPSRGDLAFPRSYCPSCRSPIRAQHLVPLISYAVLRGKCASCAAPISVRYPLVELGGAVSALLALFIFGPALSAVFAFIFLLFVLALGVIDLETGYLPDALTVALIVFGVLASVLGLFAATPGAAVLGAIIGYGAFRLIDLAFLRLRGIEGLGQGDAKLLAAFGAWFGWPLLPPIVFAAALMALIGIGLARLGGAKIGRETQVPFGPALAAAGAAAMIAHGLRLPFFS